MLRDGAGALSQDGRGRVVQSLVETKRALPGKGEVTRSKRSDGNTSVRRICLQFVSLWPTTLPISEYSHSNTSRRRKTARSIGVNRSSNRKAIDKDSSTFMIPNGSVPGSVTIGSGSHSPTYSSRRTRAEDRKSTRLNSSHLVISYAVFCLKKKNKHNIIHCT